MHNAVEEDEGNEKWGRKLGESGESKEKREEGEGEDGDVRSRGGFCLIIRVSRI